MLGRFASSSAALSMRSEGQGTYISPKVWAREPLNEPAPPIRGSFLASRPVLWDNAYLFRELI